MLHTFSGVVTRTSEVVSTCAAVGFGTSAVSSRPASARSIGTGLTLVKATRAEPIACPSI